MSCARCDQLARDLADAREELEAWRANDRAEGRADIDLSRHTRWADLIGGTGQRVGILLSLLDRPGLPVSYQRLAERLGEDVTVETVKVQLWHLRRCIKRRATQGRLPRRYAALDGGITTHWGLGVSIAADAARELKAAAGEAA